MNKFRDYRLSAIDLVEAGDGEVSEELFVEKPGALVLATDQGITNEARKLFDKLNLDSNQNDDDRLAEFIARITYLSFPNDPERAREESVKLHARLRELNHNSPYEVATQRPNILVAGPSIETLFEMVANKYGIGRVSSSRTEAMNSPLFRIPEGNDYLRTEIRSFLRETRARYDQWRAGLDKDALKKDGTTPKDVLEVLNMLHPGTKAGHMVIAAAPDFWEKKLGRRLADHPDGVERELRAVLKPIADALNKVYPGIIHSSAYYA